MAPKNKISEAISKRLSVALLVVGVVLTLAWVCVLIWFPLHLLELDKLL